MMLTNPSQLNRAEARSVPGITTAMPMAMPATTKLVSGPTPAMRASERALAGSPSSCETPPKSHSVMPATLTPLRRATIACESSCARRLA